MIVLYIIKQLAVLSKYLAIEFQYFEVNGPWLFPLPLERFTIASFTVL